MILCDKVSVVDIEGDQKHDQSNVEHRHSNEPGEFVVQIKHEMVFEEWLYLQNHFLVDVLFEFLFLCISFEFVPGEQLGLRYSKMPDFCNIVKSDALVNNSI